MSNATKDPYRVEVIADNSGKWAGNLKTFKHETQAREHAIDLASRWTLVRRWRVLEKLADGTDRVVTAESVL